MILLILVSNRHRSCFDRSGEWPYASREFALPAKGSLIDLLPAISRRLDVWHRLQIPSRFQSPAPLAQVLIQLVHSRAIQNGPRGGVAPGAVREARRSDLGQVFKVPPALQGL